MENLTRAKRQHDAGWRHSGKEDRSGFWPHGQDSPWVHWISCLPHWDPRFDLLWRMRSIKLFCFYTSFLFNTTALQRYTEMSWTREFFVKYLIALSWRGTWMHLLKCIYTSILADSSWCGKMFLYHYAHSPTPLPHKKEYILVLVHAWALTPGKCSLALFFLGDLYLMLSEAQICYRLSLL